MADETVAPLAGVTHAYSYDYQSSNVAPTSGQAHQHTTSLSAIALSETDHGGTDQSAFLATLNNSCTLTINGVTFNILSAVAVAGVLTLSVSPAIAAPPYGVTNITFFKPDQNTVVGGPLDFTTPTPPPAGGVPPPPQFPPLAPNTAPVAVPVGPQATPEPVVPAAVPPSVAGVVQPQFKTGSATVPPANGYFPLFTTTPYTGFPNQPPAGVPIVFTNTFNGAVAAAGQTPPWTWHNPPSTPTTAQITLNGFAPFPASSEVASVGAVHRGHAGPSERRRRTVLSRSDNRPQH